jgi:cytochrome c553
MTPIAAALSPEDVADVAAFYANADGEFLPLKAPDPKLLERGEQLARVGDAAKDLQSCNNCHGPDGAGEPPAIPYLAGQYAQYTAFTLKMWQHGYRSTSPEAMAEVAKRLNDEDIAAVAAYFQQLRGWPETAMQVKE